MYVLPKHYVSKVVQCQKILIISKIEYLKLPPKPKFFSSNKLLICILVNGH